MTDDFILQKLLGFKQSKGITEMLLGRRLFKRVYYGSPKPGVNLEELRNALEKHGLHANDYVVELENVKGYGDEIYVVDKSKEITGRLSELSPLVKTLMGLLKERVTLVVAVKRERAKAAHDAIDKLLID